MATLHGIDRDLAPGIVCTGPAQPSAAPPGKDRAACGLLRRANAFSQSLGSAPPIDGAGRKLLGGSACAGAAGIRIGPRCSLAVAPATARGRREPAPTQARWELVAKSAVAPPTPAT